MVFLYYSNILEILNETLMRHRGIKIILLTAQSTLCANYVAFALLHSIRSRHFAYFLKEIVAFLSSSLTEMTSEDGSKWERPQLSVVKVNCIQNVATSLFLSRQLSRWTVNIQSAKREGCGSVKKKVLGPRVKFFCFFLVLLSNVNYLYKYFSAIAVKKKIIYIYV